MKKIFKVMCLITISVILLACNKKEVEEFKNNIQIDKEFKVIEFNNISIEIPKEFEIMDEETLKLKYPSENRADYIYTNEDATVNILLNLNSSNLSNDDIEKFITYYEKLLKYSLGDNVEILSNKMYKYNNYNIGELKYISEAIDTSIYNQTIIFSTNNITKIIGFNCTEEQRDEWEEIGEYIIKSIKIK